MTAAGAERIIAARQAAATKIVIDWEHATLWRAKKGEEAPAAGWIDPRDLAWREGVGLVALRRDWTPRAEAQIESREYLYGSPVFQYDPVTGDVLSLHSFALTNDPGLDGIAVALSALLPDPPTQEDTQVEELIEQLRWLLNLPVGATVDDIKGHLQKLMDQLGTNPTAAASFDLTGHVAALSARATQPDPALYVPVDVHKKVTADFAALSQQVRTDKVSALVTAALADTRLLPAQEQWARDLGMQDIAQLEAFLATAQPIAALSRMQTAGDFPGVGGNKALTDTELAVCSQMGISPEDFLKNKETK